MLLREMFSAIGAPKDEEGDIDWVSDLKFFIDNDSDILSKQMFPAIKKHRTVGNHPDAYKIYIKPVQECMKLYAGKYEISEVGKKIPMGDLIGLAKSIAEEQNRHIENGDYEN